MITSMHLNLIRPTLAMSALLRSFDHSKMIIERQSFEQTDIFHVVEYRTSLLKDHFYPTTP